MDIEIDITIEQRIAVLYQAGITKPETILNKIKNFCNIKSVRTI